MSFLINFVPIILFVLLFVGSGIYFTSLEINNAFYQVSPLTCIIPAIIVGFLIRPGKTNEKINDFLDGVRHRDIITMCIIFLLAGAFSEITKSIGSIESTVNFALSIIPEKFILIGLFIVSAFVSTSIGTSMGTIATVGPIASLLSNTLGLQIDLSIGTVISGAMFGDNLSLVSDTTIASVMSQGSDNKKKLILNGKIAFIASALTILVLFNMSSDVNFVEDKEYRFILILPYLVLLALSVLGVNIFTSLIVSIGVAGIIGFIKDANYSIIIFSQSLNKGFASMNEIMLLSLLVGGLSGLVMKNSTEDFIVRLCNWIESKNGGIRLAQLMIAKVVSIFDILLANNTVAIVFSGDFAKRIAQKYKIPPHYSASWLDIFSCVFQGIIPHGAQVLLASAIAQISPFEIIKNVYYCYFLFVVAIIHILLTRKLDLSLKS